MLQEMKEMAVDLSGRVAIVTGAGQGIGTVYARYLARSRAQVVVAEVSAERGQLVAEQIASEGGQACFIETDVADEASVAQAISQVILDFGRIDILVNNAAIFSNLKRSTFDQIDLVEWNRVMKVNVNGPFLMARGVFPHMKEKNYGRIINISSTTVQAGRPNFLHYVTSKSALLGMTRSMAREVGQFGITVNTLMPTLIETGIDTDVVNPALFDTIARTQCIARVGQPEDLARVLMFLVCEESGFVTGQTIAVDGGSIHL